MFSSASGFPSFQPLEVLRFLSKFIFARSGLFSLLELLFTVCFAPISLGSWDFGFVAPLKFNFLIIQEVSCLVCLSTAALKHAKIRRLLFEPASIQRRNRRAVPPRPNGIETRADSLATRDFWLRALGALGWAAFSSLPVSFLGPSAQRSSRCHRPLLEVVVREKPRFLAGGIGTGPERRSPSRPGAAVPALQAAS